MRKLFRTFALLLTSLLTVSMLTGCGGDDDGDEEAPSASFVSAAPPGGDIAANGTITVTLTTHPLMSR